MAGMKKTAQKLQRALCLMGEPISFEEKTFWSIKYEKFLTKYIIRRRRPGMKTEKLLETYALKDAVICLHDLYAQLQEADGHA